MKIWWKISYFVDKKKNSVRERSLFFLDFPEYLIFLSYFLISLCLHIKLKVYGHIYTIYRASKPFQKSLSNWESQVYFLLMVLIPLSILNLGMIIRLPRTVLWVAVLFNVMLTPYFAAKIYCIILLLNVDLIPVHVVFPKINQIVFS